MIGDRVVVALVVLALIFGVLGMCQSDDGSSRPPDDGGYGCTPYVDC